MPDTLEKKLDLSNGKFHFKDFSNQDLREVPMHHSTFLGCNFDRCDMTDVDASYSVFRAGSMVDTKCTNTNFMRSVLALKFHPKDCFGMTLTLDCKTFTGMAISRIWWYGWMYFGMQMSPELEDGKDPRDILIALMGKDKFLRLSALFKSRQI